MPRLRIKASREIGWRALPALAVILAFVLLASNGRAQAEKLPPKPAGYFTDEADVVDATTGHAINEQLAQFERDTSNQILVAVYPSLPDGAEVAQYSIDTFNAWKPGQKGQDNGAILFVFTQDHKIFICTGRGLEGSLPDAICKDIVRDVITPSFRKNDYAGGIQAGVNAMIAATKGEYKGSGETDQEKEGGDSGTDSGGGLPIGVVIFIFILIFVVSRFFGGFRGVPMIYTGGGWGGGGGFGGFGGGGGGGGGFSGFSGGGGSSAGGGAGGSW